MLRVAENAGNMGGRIINLKISYIESFCFYISTQRMPVQAFNIVIENKPKCSDISKV